MDLAVLMGTSPPSAAFLPLGPDCDYDYNSSLTDSPPDFDSPALSPDFSRNGDHNFSDFAGAISYPMKLCRRVQTFPLTNHDAFPKPSSLKIRSVSESANLHRSASPTTRMSIVDLQRELANFAFGNGASSTHVSLLNEKAPSMTNGYSKHGTNGTRAYPTAHISFATEPMETPPPHRNGTYHYSSSPGSGSPDVLKMSYGAIKVSPEVNSLKLAATVIQPKRNDPSDMTTASCKFSVHPVTSSPADLAKISSFLIVTTSNSVSSMSDSSVTVDSPFRKSTTEPDFEIIHGGAHTFPGAKRHKKRVAFADDRGLALVTVRVMSEPSDMPPKLSSSVFKALIGEAYEEPRPDATWELDFVQPASEYLVFRQKLESNNVAVENVMLRNDKCKLIGTVRVRNLTINKNVFLRYTSNNWISYLDREAVFSGQVPDDPFDTFSFEVDIPFDDDDYMRFEFCVCFRTDDGREFWDSNGGKNFVVLSKRAKALTQSNKLIDRKNDNGSNKTADGRPTDAFQLNLAPGEWTSFASWTHLTTVNAALASPSLHSATPLWSNRPMSISTAAPPASAQPPPQTVASVSMGLPTAKSAPQMSWSISSIFWNPSSIFGSPKAPGSWSQSSTPQVVRRGSKSVESPETVSIHSEPASPRHSSLFKDLNLLAPSNF